MTDPGRVVDWEEECAHGTSQEGRMRGDTHVYVQGLGVGYLARVGHLTFIYLLIRCCESLPRNIAILQHLVLLQRHAQIAQIINLSLGFVTLKPMQ
jgi:hypothetical protein